MRISTLVTLTLLGLPGVTLAGTREWKQARKTYDATCESIAADRGKDPEASQKLMVTLAESSLEMMKQDAASTVEHLLDVGVSHESRIVARDALRNLRLTKDTRALRALVKGFESAKGDERFLLVGTVSACPGKSVDGALLKALKDKDERVRAEAARALGGRSSAKESAPGPLKRLLRDDSLRVRYAAAGAITALTGAAPKGFEEPVLDGTTGLPDAFTIDRVAFLIDATSPAGEVAFEDPFYEAPADEGEQKDDKGQDGEKKEPKGPPEVAPIAVMNAMITKAVATMSGDTRFHAVRFGTRSRAYAKGFGSGGAKAVSGLKSWLDRPIGRDLDRDVAGALESVITLDPPPQEIYLYLVGPPLRRGRDASDATLETLEGLLWGKGIRLHVMSFMLPPAQEPGSNLARQREEDAQKAYGQIGAALAQLGGGRMTRMDLVRATEPEAAEAPAAETPDLGVDLTKPLTAKSEKTVKKAFKKALESGDPAALVLIEDVAACPDARRAAPYAIEALRAENFAVANAAVRGLARNSDPKVREAVLKAFRKEKDPARQILLLKAFGAAPGADVTAALVGMLSFLDPDPARLAWKALADRPKQELIPLASKLSRPAKGLEGLSAFYAAQAQAKASGRPAPPTTGLHTDGDHFLPERFMAKGVAFILDSNRAMERPFWQPPAPPPEPGKKPKKPKKGKDGKPEPRPLPDPITCLGAARAELKRALGVLGRGELHTNVFLTSGKAWEGKSVSLKGRTEAVQEFVEDFRSTPVCDLSSPLRRALEDPNVEQIYLLVASLPTRGEGSRDPEALLDRVRELNRRREISIQVCYVLPPINAKDAEANARRQDERAALDALYERLAQENNGKVIVRTALPDLAKRKPAGTNKR